MRRRDFVKTTTTGVIGGAYALAGGQERARPLEPGRVARLDPGRYDETWWNRRPVRLVQTNLREIDARMDLDAYVRWMVENSVNLVLLNVGGIVANYPTRLEFHYRNPFMEGDLVGDLITRLHERDIRVMGRFDFSKINETLAARRPDWLYVSAEGENVNYNGQVHVCPSRGYQQEYVFRILEEAITSYPLDAIFFNMVGYRTRDYSGNEYGQCRCEDCRRLFDGGSGRTRDEVANELFTRIHGYIRELDPDIVISTYTTVGVDMVASESSSSLSTDHEWTYSATDQVKRTLDSYTDLVSMNLLIGFPDIGFRHIATSPHIARVWQTQNMLHGGSLDYVFIGPAHEYQDRAFVPTLQELYRFHASHEELFTNLRSAGRVALVRGRGDEYRGLIKLLSEEHVIYDIISTDVIGTDRMPRPLEDYDAVVLGDVRDMSAELVALVDDYVRAGGKVLATGFSSVRTPEAGGSEEGDDALHDPQSRIQLECLGVIPEYEFFPQSRSTYLNITAADKAALGEAELADFDLMMAYEDLMRVRPRPAARGYMNLIPNTMFGPPEKNYFLEDEITEYPGVVYHEYGGGKSVLVPWGLGAQYYAKGHHIHRTFFGAVLRNVLQVERSVETDAPHLVEVSHLTNRDGAFEWIGLVNHTGQIGPTLGAAVPIRDITVRLKPSSPAREISLMRAGLAIDAEPDADGWIEVIVPELAHFEMMVCSY